MKPDVKIKSYHIAPCGMNCALCLGYQREKNHCPGCNAPDTDKINFCARCSMKHCEFYSGSKAKFCFSCKKYPCKKVKHIDKRYRTKYGMSMIENLNTIKETGIRNFIKLEKQKWTCPECGNLVCVHRENCLVCETEKKITQTQ
jgi:hypothetical protein